MANTQLGIGNGSNFYHTGQLDGYVAVTTAFGFDSSLILADTSCLLLGVTVYNNSGSTRTLQVFDSQIAPNAGDVPKHILVVPTTGEASLGFGAAEVSLMQFGLTLVSSTTVATYTATSSPDLWLQVWWLKRF